jgi:tRNA (guanine-N7-)-methyltransferase
MNDPSIMRRPVRSFVLRQGRVSNAQGRAYEQLLPRYGLPFRAETQDLAAAFGRAAPTILEIGFGMGETTAEIAASRPEHNFLGIEVHTPGVGSLLKQIEERSLGNVRVVQHDAVEVLELMLAPETLAGAHIFFPDPWPKKRHHKRRLIQPPLIALLASRLQSGGYLHVATDWEDYARQILTVLNANPALRNSCADFAPRPNTRPLTKFETRGLRLGHAVRDLVFVKD